MQYTNVTFRLTDGSLFSLPRRFKRHQVTLLQSLQLVPDGRSRQGLRHPLENILAIILYGLLAGYTQITEMAEFAKAEEKFFAHILEIPHGIPHPTTISYALQLCDVRDLTQAYLAWRETIYGGMTDTVASFDGKTMRGVHGTHTVAHILSLMTHDTLTPLGQMGVTDKENEIPAARRLFQEILPSRLVNLTLVADALHTQTVTATAIRRHHAHYLLMVKDNQEILKRDIAEYFTHTTDTLDTASSTQSGHGAHITTTVTISHDPQMREYLSQETEGKEGWKDISTIGMIRRVGTRTHLHKTQAIDETVSFIASTPHLTADLALLYIRNHWRIENNLHRTKDIVYREDMQTLRLGNAPQVLTFMRSIVINLFTTLRFAQISRSTRILRHHPNIHRAFVRWAALL